MKNPHKHSEFIIEWANGETIQAKGDDGPWREEGK